VLIVTLVYVDHQVSGPRLDQLPKLKARSTLQVSSAPDANVLEKWQHRSTIVGQRVFDGRWNRTFRLSLHESVAGQLAKLLGEDLLRDTRHQSTKRGEVLRRFRQPVQDNQFPFTTNRCQCSSQRAIRNRIGTRRSTMVTFRCLLDGPHGVTLYSSTNEDRIRFTTGGDQ